MTVAPAFPFLGRRGKLTAAPRGPRPSLPAERTSGSAEPIEIVAPDRRSTDRLLEHAAPLFPAEILPGCVWIVRLQPPTGTGGGWVLELLALVERWLESCRLPRATVLYGGRSYLVRASSSVAQFTAAPESTRALSGQIPS